jgi:transcriptional regulator with XRE-family HTH domain
MTKSPLTQTRKATGKTQTAFWAQYGITQSGGSRYESGRDIPEAVKMLMWLHQNGRLSDQDLEDAGKLVNHD